MPLTLETSKNGSKCPLVRDDPLFGLPVQRSKGALCNGGGEGHQPGTSLVAPVVTPLPKLGLGRLLIATVVNLGVQVREI